MKRKINLNKAVLKHYPYQIGREYLYTLRVDEGLGNALQLATAVSHWSKDYIKNKILNNHKWYG